MLFFNRYYNLFLISTASVVSCLLALELPSDAATFSSSQASLTLDNFSILPQNPRADSYRNAIASTGNQSSVADAVGDGILAFTIENNEALIKLDFTSQASGEGNSYYSIGEASAIASSTFLVEQNQTLSFDFEIALALENRIDSEFDGSVNSFTEVTFSLFDNRENTFLGELIAIGNLDTNLANSINEDTIFASSNLNFTVDSFDDNQLFVGNQEIASINVSGKIQQTFTEATQVTLQANSFNLSCTQSVQNSNPCIKVAVSESDNFLALITGLIGIGFLGKSSKARYRSLKISK